ncbi:leucine-rich repeat-containing protein 3-like, partial [Chrysoperla carnea]|uniref:leucine-rich repeat-containing protein 3-like n=1 Tax=Chrysoperla carnea TaxID=189513 RepID=UPI001D07B0ED
PKIFKNMISLRFLNLANNEFVSIPTDLFNIPQLNLIDLSRNELIYLSSNIFEGEDCVVERLNIGSNKLTYLENDFLKRSKLKYLDLRNNPWQCECLNEIIDEMYRLNMEFPKRRDFDGTYPCCVVTDNNTCVRETFLSSDLFKKWPKDRNRLELLSLEIYNFRYGYGT